MPSDVLKLIFTTKKRKKKFWTPKIFGCFGLGVGLGFGCFGFGCWVGCWVFWVWVWVWVETPKPNPNTQFFLGSGDCICVHIIVLENGKFLIFFFNQKKKGLNFEKGPSFF